LKHTGSVQIIAGVNCINATSRKTRIETGLLSSPFQARNVLTPLPEKQGLKHEANCGMVFNSKGINATSRKTRIETYLFIILFRF